MSLASFSYAHSTTILHPTGMSIPAPLVNLQISPGFVAFPPSLHPGIGACDPASYGLLTPGAVPGHPTAVLTWCEGSAKQGEYPSMLWAPAHLLPIPAEISVVHLDLDFTPSASYIKGGNCAEIDTMFTHLGMTFPGGLHFLLAQGGKAQVCDPTGAKWLDAGFAVEFAPDTTHHITIQHKLDWNANTLTWLGVIVDGKTYSVEAANATVKSDNWGWSDGFKPQIQMDNLPQAPMIAAVWDNLNYWME
jgi:hypothetical protein